jgi:hypothetical protein
MRQNGQMEKIILPYLWMYAGIIAVGIWQYFFPTRHLIPVDYAPAVESTKLLKEWCSWLATLSTASIGASAFTSAGILSGQSSPALSNLAVAAFGSSLICTATLMLSLPSLILRLIPTRDVGNDIYELAAFMWIPGIVAPFFRIGFLAFAQYYFFVVGVVAFAIAATRAK